MASFDFVVIGQGLAGTALAWQLRWKGLRVLVLDRDDLTTPSRIAAALLTPITGQRLAPAWRWAELWPAAVRFYHRVEQEIGTAVLHSAPMVRLFANEAEQHEFARRTVSGFGPVATRPAIVRPAWFDSTLGGFEMEPAARLDVGQYLDGSRRRFAADGGFRVAAVDPERDVAFHPGGIELPGLGVRARAVIACLGPAARGVRWFPQVRWNPARGEVLTLQIPTLAETRVIHRGIWLAPVGESLYRVGSTYDRASLDAGPTPAGRAELTGRLRDFLRLPFEVIDQQSAVRPATLDGRPVLGWDPTEAGIVIFNGLGSKGALLSPFFSEQLAATLIGEGRIEGEVDVRRMGPAQNREGT